MFGSAAPGSRTWSSSKRRSGRRYYPAWRLSWIVFLASVVNSRSLSRRAGEPAQQQDHSRHIRHAEARARLVEADMYGKGLRVQRGEDIFIGAVVARGEAEIRAGA